MRGTPALGGAGETPHRGEGYAPLGTQRCGRGGRPSPVLARSYCRGGGPRRRIPSAPRGGGRGWALTSPPLPHRLQEGGSGGKGSDPPQFSAATPKLGRLAAWTCPDKLGFSSALFRSPCALSFRLLLVLNFPPRTGASGDVATWVPAARADRTLVGDMLKIGGKQSWYFRYGF